MWVKTLKTLPLFGLMLLSFATGVFAGDYDCETDNPKVPICDYKAVGTTVPTGLCELKDNSSTDCKTNAKPGVTFYIIAPDAGSDSLLFKVHSTGDVITADKAPVSDASGTVRIDLKGLYPKYNVVLGVLTSDNKTTLARVMNFYAPELKYCADADCKTPIDGNWNAQLKVGEKKQIFVQAIFPIGPDKGKADATLKGEAARFYITTKPGDESLEFFNESGTPLDYVYADVQETIAVGYLDSLNEGKTSFWISAKKAVSGVDFSTNSIVDIQANGDVDFLSKAPFPGKLDFVNEGLPSLDSAFIFDADGDGVGDSVSAYFNGKLQQIVFSNYKFNWPNDGDYKGFNSNYVDPNDNKGVAEFSGVQSSLPDSIGKGSIMVDVKSEASGVQTTLDVKLVDRIGPVIMQATLIKTKATEGKALDTLILHFNKAVDESWTEGAGFVLNKNPFSMKAIEKEGEVWTFVIPVGSASIGDNIGIATTCAEGKCPDGLVKAADGNKTGKNNPALITDSGLNYVDNENNGFYDRDGDGRMDSATVAFENAITEKDLEGMEITLYWTDNAGQVVEITPDLADRKVVNLSENGKIVEIKVDAVKYDIKQMLTSVDTAGLADSLKYGYAKVSKKIQIDGKDSTVVENYSMNDRMSPVVVKTFLQPESFQRMEADVLTINFSEPINRESVTSADLADCFSFYVDGNWVNLSFNSVEWNEDGRSVKVHLETGVKLSKRLNPSDSIRFDNTAIELVDMNGNGISGKAPEIVVEGNPRVLMETTPMATLKQMEDLPEDVAVSPEFYRSAKEVEQGLGVLMDISFATALDKDSTGATIMNLEEVGLKWELNVYTSLGAYVAGDKGTVRCNDEAFNGNCFENARMLYLRWNMRADDGRKAGVGVYIAQFKVKVFGASGTGTNGEAFKVERLYKWGLRAGKN